MCKLAAVEISIFLLVSLAGETGLKLASSNPKDRFSRVEVHIVGGYVPALFVA